MKNILLTIMYDGTKYRGFQRLKNTDMTIQSKLEIALSKIFDQSIQITATSRTDKGVHAKSQQANFHVKTDLKANEIKKIMNEHLPKDITISKASFVPKDFHARFKKSLKTYSYTIWTQDYTDIFHQKYSVDANDLNIPYEQLIKLDYSAMKEAINALEGTHDFKGFCTDKTKKSTVRTIKSIEIKTTSEGLTFIFKGEGFLYNMVRIIVGTLIEIGLHKKTIDTIQHVFEHKKRADAGFTVPAKGLTLESIEFYNDKNHSK